MNKVYLIRQNKTFFGGAERYLTRLKENLDQKGLPNVVLSSNFPKILPGWLKVIMFNIKVCLFRKEGVYFSLDRIICPDIYRAGDGVHKHFLRIEKKSLLNPLHPIYLFLEKKCFRNAKKIIANSDMIKQQIIHYYKIDAKKIDVLYNGISFPKYDIAESFKKISIEFPQIINKKIFLFIGSGYERKGVVEFLDILKKIKNQNYIAIVIGKEKKIDFYKKISVKYNLSERVIFLGPRFDVEDFYAIGDFYILPTKYEPFSNTILEAMYFRNIVFTTSDNGASEILSSDFVFDRNNLEKVSRKIDSLFDQPKQMENIKQKNFERSQMFSIETNSNLIIKLVEEIASPDSLN